ncbi:hypothetical protein Pyrde_1753 [Pyrodictium delaneyi]|uniref:Uncharacterized protein n=1 Tax=Pyrodictium delaneyi TaxID=1273541 RepID=A0A0P0N5X2_9CREN|nr:hypothetical protein Pyrde_1753 [Pyrodictium delaneyi]
MGDYEPLYLYWQEAGERAGESVLSNEDFKELQRLITREGLRRLDQLLARLQDYFLPRVDPGAARRALSRYYGVEIGEDEAAQRIASILAGWLVEAASEWGMLRLRRGWEKQGEHRED